MKALWLFAAVVAVWALPITGQAQAPIVIGEDEESEKYVTCSLDGDPKLTNFMSQRGNLPFPCFSFVASLRLEFNENSSAAERGFDYFIINAYASAGLKTFHGRYFVDKVNMEIAGYYYEGANDNLKLRAKGTYKTSSSNVKTFLNSDQTPEDESKVWDTNSTFGNGVVRTGYDTGEKIAFLKLLRRNNPPLEITFRPRNETEGIPQSRRPGFFINARKGRLKAQPDAKFPGTLCSTKADGRTFRDIRNLPRYGGRLETNRHLMLYASYSQALDRDVDQTEPKCIDAVAAYESCIGEAKRQQAMNRCSDLTTARNVSCLESLESAPGNALVAFTKCVNFCCNVDRVNAKSWLENAKGSCNIAIPVPIP